MILIGILIDDLEFCKDFFTTLIPSVCGILVYKDLTSSETKFESLVMLLTSSIFFNAVSLLFHIWFKVCHC